MKRAFFVLLVLAAVVGGYLWAAPFLAARDLREALDAGDAVAIEERVDFPVLRDNLGEQLRAKLLAGAANEGPLKAFAMGIGSLVVDGLLEAFLTPAAIASMARGEEPTPSLPPGPRSPEPEPAPGGTGSAGEEDEPELFANARHQRDSFDRFSIYVPTEDGEELHFVLARYGLSWKLRNIILPLD